MFLLATEDHKLGNYLEAGFEQIVEVCSDSVVFVHGMNQAHVCFQQLELESVRDFM